MSIGHTIILIVGGFTLVSSIISFFTSTEYKNRRKVEKQRKEWYKKYPVGTKIEIAIWKRKQCTTQYEMNKNLKEKECSYYTVVTPQEFFNSSQGGEISNKMLQKLYMNDNGILLYCRGKNNEFRTITTETLLEIHRGYKEIHKVSDVKMKIIELKGRESKNEIVKSYSNSRKKNYRKGIQSR